MLALQSAHALARDAVHAPLASEPIVAALVGLETIEVESQAGDRRTYLTRPDLGRRLARADAARLSAGDWDLSIVLADGLSPVAVARGDERLVRRQTRLVGAR